MISSRNRVLPFLAVLAGVVLSLPAQNEGGDEGPRTRRILDQAARKGKPGPDGELTPEKLRNMTPEERLEHGKRRGSRGLCTFVAACRPPKLLPGQTGTVLISAILQGKSVLPAPSQVVMLPPSSASPLSFGGLTAHPATPGSMAKAYVGRPVYENTAEFEVPVTVPATAKLGEKLPVSFDLQFDLYDGNTANVLGRFIERVSTEIVVGPHLDPEVEGRKAPVAPKEPEVRPQPVETTADAGGTSDRGRAAPDVLTGSAGSVPEPDGGSAVGDGSGPDEAESGGTSGGLPPTSDEGGLPLPLLAGGGVILLVIVLLLARRK
ncbi:MAG TPA: hypothetical protein ENI87_12630 [bacterium]|nr:hypothetical protein [bacterium]